MKNDVYLATLIETDSIVDGPGLRAVLWFQGCSHNCVGCHNPGTHEFNTGLKLKYDEVYEMIDNLENQDGITFSGGDAFFQPEAMLDIIKYVKSKGYNTWVYTGFLWEELLSMKDIYKEILKYVDVVVDGKFDMSMKSLECKYRGSYNQRVIDVQKSLKNKKKVLFYEDEKIPLNV